MNNQKILGLVGNQNAGKTTLFNDLTGMNATVGNWPGVTIERKEGNIKGGQDLLLVDTPGVYSLSPYTSEEKITRKFCLGSHPDLIINIIDATALERSLYLTTQLAELSTDVIVALNMADILESNGISIDVDKLSEQLGLTVVRISAKTGEGVDELIDIIRHNKYKKNPHLQIYAHDIQAEINHLQGDLNTELEESKNPAFAAVNLFERDPYFVALSNSATEKEVESLEKKYGMDAEQIIADQRYDFVTSVKAACCTERPMPESLTDKLDKVFLNKYAAIPLFILIMALVYYVSISLVGGLTSSFLSALFNGSESIELLYSEVPFSCVGLGPLLGNWILSMGGNVYSADLVENGIIGGISSVISFLPQLVVLFFCLALLEGSGYMNRIAFFLDKIFKKFGLSGKSIIPFIVGTGCSVPGIMGARTVEDPNEREMTIRLTPFIPCSAKLPIISLLASVVSPHYGWLISLSVYVMAILIIVINAILMKKFMYKSENTSFIAELPSYKLPDAKNVYREVKDKTVSFVERAGTVIFLCSVAVWVLTRFSFTFQYVGPTVLGDMSTASIGGSMLAYVGKGLAYLFIPAWGGNYSWELTVSALQGIIAKEQVVSSMSVISGLDVANMVSDPSSPFYFLSSSPLTAYSFIVFNLFSVPCFGAIAAMRKELGSAKKLFSTIGIELFWSYLLATLIGTIGWAATGFGAVGGLV